MPFLGDEFVRFRGCSRFFRYDKWSTYSPVVLENSNRPLEHTPDPELPVYEGNPFIFVFWGTWGLLTRGLLEFSYSPGGAATSF